MNEPNETLHTLSAQVARQSKLRSMLTHLQQQATQLQTRERELAAKRTKEQADVDRLNGLSLSSFFYAMINRKTEKLNQEEREAYAAAVKHDAVVRELADLSEQIAHLEQEQQSLAGCQQRYEAALAEKATRIKQESPAHAAQILQLEAAIADKKAQLRETEEAIAAGQEALLIIQGILSELDSAAGWGTIDLFGGGFFSGLVKHSHLDDAQAQVEALQRQLNVFKTELCDVKLDADMQIQIDGFLRFADYFFDGFFADWAVLDHIENAQEQITQTNQQIEQMLHRLDTMRSDFSKDVSTAQAALDALVLGA